MHIRFKTGIIMAGSAAFVMMAVNLPNINKNTRIAFKPSAPGIPAEVVTLAFAPPPIIISKQRFDGFAIKINTQGNPVGTEYAVFESGTGMWVNPTTKTISANVAVWAADIGAWNTHKGGIILTGLLPNKAYTFIAKARNLAKQETIFGPASVGVTVFAEDMPERSTIATIVDNGTKKNDTNTNTGNDILEVPVNGLLPPGRPSVVHLNPKELLLTIDANGNTSSTSFAIQDAISGKYVQANGRLGDAVVYRIFLDWGGDSGFVIKTEPNRVYRFQVIAKPRGEWQ